MEKVAKIKVVRIVVGSQERDSDDFKAPGKYYIINAMGDAVYYKTRDRQKAQQMADQDYGVGHYTIRLELKAQIR